MKVIYRIQKKSHIKGRSKKLLSEMFFSSDRKAAKYLHNKFAQTDVKQVEAYTKGKSLRIKPSVYAPTGDFIDWSIDFIPVN